MQTVRVVNSCDAISPKYLDKYPIIVSYYRNRGSVRVEEINEMKG